MDKLLKLLGSTDLIWSEVKFRNTVTNFQGRYAINDFSNDMDPFYTIEALQETGAVGHAPSKVDEPIKLMFCNKYYVRTLTISFSHFYELLSFFNSEARKKIENWYFEDRVHVELNFYSIESAVHFFEGREIAKQMEPLRTGTVTLLELLYKTIGPLEFPEILADFISDLYETDGIPTTYEESQDADAFTTSCCLDDDKWLDGSLLATREIGLYLGENFKTEVEVTQVINSCAPAYQIWFKMHDKTYFFGCEHSIFLY